MPNPRVSIWVLIALLAACTTRSGVIQDGPDRYMVIMAGKTGFTPVGKLKIRAYRDASAFCTSRGMRMEAITEKSVPTGFMRFPESELHFKCVPAAP